MKRIVLLFYAILMVPTVLFAGDGYNPYATGDSLLLIAHDYPATITYFNHLSAKGPDADILYRLGLAYGLMNDMEHSREFLNQAATLRFGGKDALVQYTNEKRQREFADRMVRFGDTCSSRNQFDMAKECYRYAAAVASEKSAASVAYDETKAIINSKREGWIPMRTVDGTFIRDKSEKLYFYADPTGFDSDVPPPDKDSVKWSDFSSGKRMVKLLSNGTLQVWILSYRPVYEPNENGREELGPDGEYYAVYASNKDLMQFDYGRKQFRVVENYQYDNFGKVTAHSKDNGADWNRIVPGTIAEKLFQALERIR